MGLASREELRTDSNWSKVFGGLSGADLTDEKLKDVFEHIDVDGSGELDVDELQQCMKSLGANISKEDILKMMQLGDADADGAVDFDEFVKMVRAIDEKAQRRAAEKKWCSVFSAFPLTEMDDKGLHNLFNDIDADSSGSLDKSEVASLLENATGGQQDAGTLAMIDHMITSADVDGDGQIDFDEFVQMVRVMGKKMGGRAKRRHTS